MTSVEKQLSDAIDAAAAEHLDDGEVVMTWVALVATGSFESGNILTLVSEDGMPSWQLRGILHTALLGLDQWDSGELLEEEDDE